MIECDSCDSLEKDFISSVDLEVGSVFKRRNDNTDSEYIYIGFYDLFSLEEIDNTIFLTCFQKVESMVHVFYNKQRDEYSSFKWSTADLLEDKCDPEEFKKILHRFKAYAHGMKIKYAEFHVGHLSFNNDLPVNISSNKFSLFSKSFFKELDAEAKIYLAIEWSSENEFPNLKNFKPHIIKLVNGDEFAFDYIDESNWSKFKDFFNLDDVKDTIDEVQYLANQSPGLMGIFSSEFKAKFFEDKLKKFKDLKFGSIYLIGEK